jgi:hypothetical protein
VARAHHNGDRDSLMGVRRRDDVSACYWNIVGPIDRDVRAARGHGAFSLARGQGASDGSTGVPRCRQVFFELLELGVFRFRGDEDGDIGVGVFPQREEVLICRSCFGGVALQGVGTG